MSKHGHDEEKQAENRGKRFDATWNETRGRIVEKKTRGGMQRDASKERKWGRK